MKHVFALILAIYATFHVMVFNDYMHPKSFQAEVVDKHMIEREPSKVVLTIEYKREDGRVFERHASIAEWHAALPGEKHWVRARPIDVEPTPMKTLRYTALPILMVLLTGFYLLWFLLFFSWTVKPKQEQSLVQVSSPGSVEE